MRAMAPRVEAYECAGAEQPPCFCAGSDWCWPGHAVGAGAQPLWAAGRTGNRIRVPVQEALVPPLLPGRGTTAPLNWTTCRPPRLSRRHGGVSRLMGRRFTKRFADHCEQNGQAARLGVSKRLHPTSAHSAAYCRKNTCISPPDTLENQCNEYQILLTGTVMCMRRIFDFRQKYF